MTDLSWSAEQKADFRRRPMTFAHDLAQQGLFEDASLAELLDRHPAELYDINLFTFDADGRHTMRTGARGRRPGAELLEGIKQGRIWIQLRSIDKHDGRVGEAVRRAFARIDAETGGFKPSNVNAALILSAPGAAVPMHADAPGVVLFHLRGRKRIWIYPPDEAHLPTRAMEDIVLKQTTEDLPYDRAMDARAQAFDLTPGAAVAWPQHAPHRIENADGFNVSLTVDYVDWPARTLNGAYYAAGVLRRRGLSLPRASRLPAAARTALWAAHLGLRRMNLVQDRIAGLEREFELGDHDRAAA